MKYIVVSHAPFPWKIPFEHIEIGVGDYTPEQGLTSKVFSGNSLCAIDALGGARAMPALRSVLMTCAPNETVFASSYRMFMGKTVEPNWVNAHPEASDRLMVHPTEFETNYQNLIALELPSDVDFMICAPLNLGTPIISHYQASHHLDDLLHACGCAIRAGLIRAQTAAMLLTSNVFIPYGYYASTANFRLDLTDRLLWCMEEYFFKHHIPREGYQRRSIDFAFERIMGACLYEKVTEPGIRVAASRPVLVTETGSYSRSQ